MRWLIESPYLVPPSTKHFILVPSLNHHDTMVPPSINHLIWMPPSIDHLKDHYHYISTKQYCVTILLKQSQINVHIKGFGVRN